MAPVNNYMAQGKVRKDKIKAFQKRVLDFYKKEGRHTLPWRKTKNPYRILVSEVMLQQTQVERVIPYYKTFLKQFPTIAVLAEASLGDVLRAWQGLGYNRRAKMLHEAAKAIQINHGGRTPHEHEKLIELPGVGEYTAKAVRVFAYNEPEVMIETNIRTVFLHRFFPNKKGVEDKELLLYMEQSLDIENSCTWYAALMDYGSHLKKVSPNPSRMSTHHIKQKPFKGSNREIRGAILRSLTENSRTKAQIISLPFDNSKISDQLNALVKERMIVSSKRWYSLAD